MSAAYDTGRAQPVQGTLAWTPIRFMVKNAFIFFASQNIIAGSTSQLTALQ
jgi:hypothetical protein